MVVVYTKKVSQITLLFILLSYYDDKNFIFHIDEIWITPPSI